MKLLKIGGSILLLVTLITTQTRAQDVSGSVYSVYGIGDLKWKGSALNRVMGGTGIAVRDIYNLNTANPAAYTAIAPPVSKLFEFGGYSENNTFRNSSSSTNYQAGTISSLNYWFKFSPKFAGVAGIAPLSSSSYNVTSNQAISAGASLIPVNYEGSGGFNQFYLGNSFQIIKNLSIGVNASLILGSLNKKAITGANSFSGALESNTKLFAQGANFDAGIQYVFNVKQSQFTFGATYKTSTKLNGYNQTVLTTLSSGSTRETDKLSVNYTLPKQYGAGFSYMRKRIVLAADVSFQEWAKAKLENGTITKDVFRYSFGGEYKGSLETSNYLKAISWRAGFHMQDYYIIVRNTQLSSWGYTIGAGLPLNGNFATVNVNYSFTNFGTTTNGLVQQESNKLSVDVIIRDIWGIRRKFD
jgi:hypothetical protein